MAHAMGYPSAGSGADDWKVIGLVGTAHAGSHFFQLVIPSLYVSMGPALGLDYTRLGFMMSVFFVLSALGQASSGFIVDRWGARPVLWFGQACFVVSAVLMGLANGYPMLVLAAAIGGIGNSVFHPADFSILNRRVSAARLGHAFSWHGLTGSLGWAATPLFVTGLTLLGGWRTAAFGVAVLLGLVLTATLVWRRLLGDEAVERGAADGHAAGRPRAAGQANLRALVANPALWGAFVFFALTSTSLSAIQNFTLPILHAFYDMSQVYASSALSSYMVASACGMFVGGFLAGAQPRTERTVAAAFVLGGALLLCLASGAVPSYLALITLAAAGFCSGVAGPSRDMLIRRVTPKGALGSVYGLVYSGMDVGAALAPLAFGLMVDAGVLRGPWLIAGAAFWLAAVTAGFIARRARRAEAETVTAAA
ncbi:MFS transporter [Verticiella sediminum]|uniref:MFS transporter n=1 Tax=Verticiella sediminum TaxID=1247510 RepID=A0A556AUC9_9BURK|nr:MFS transporter [Verticiella sediminum]TSH96520.1 MFS transporter [Verticiella sediminum]